MTETHKSELLFQSMETSVVKPDQKDQHFDLRWKIDIALYTIYICTTHKIELGDRDEHQTF